MNLKPVGYSVVLVGLFTVLAQSAGYAATTHESNVDGAYAWSTQATVNVADTLDDGDGVYALYFRTGDSKEHRLVNNRGVNRTTSKKAKVEAVRACVARQFRRDSCGDYG